MVGVNKLDRENTNQWSVKKWHTSKKKYRGTSDQKHRPSGMFFHHSFSTDNDRMPSSG